MHPGDLIGDLLHMTRDHEYQRVFLPISYMDNREKNGIVCCSPVITVVPEVEDKLGVRASLPDKHESCTSVIYMKTVACLGYDSVPTILDTERFVLQDLVPD